MIPVYTTAPSAAKHSSFKKNIAKAIFSSFLGFAKGIINGILLMDNSFLLQCGDTY